MRLLIFTMMALLIASEFSCVNESKEDDLYSQLIGEWELDSVSVNQTTMAPAGPYGSTSLTFKTNHDYTMIAKDGDEIAWSISGKYFVVHNPRRKAHTIAYIPDTVMENNFSYRPLCRFDDILNIQGNSLHVVESSSYLQERMSKNLKHHCVYKRKE